MKKSAFFTLLATLGLMSCLDTKNLNYLDSDNYDSKNERVEVLKKEIKWNSEFENAEFELFNVNGFSNSRATIPGASSWNYKLVVKVKPAEIDLWTKGMKKTNLKDYNKDWMAKIIEKRKKEWLVTSQPEFFVRSESGVTLVLHRPEGIIFKQIIAN